MLQWWNLSTRTGSSMRDDVRLVSDENLEIELRPRPHLTTAHDIVTVARENSENKNLNYKKRNHYYVDSDVVTSQSHEYAFARPTPTVPSRDVTQIVNQSTDQWNHSLSITEFPPKAMHRQGIFNPKDSSHLVTVIPEPDVQFNPSPSLERNKKSTAAVHQRRHQDTAPHTNKPLPLPLPPEQSRTNKFESVELGTCLLHAVESNDAAVLAGIFNYALQEGIAIQEYLNEQHGLLLVSILHLAAFEHPELVPMLIRHGIDVKAVDKLGRTSLHLACVAGHESCVDALIKAGADVNTQIQLQKQDQTPKLNKKKKNQQESSKKSSNITSNLNMGKNYINLTTSSMEKFRTVGNKLPFFECWGRTPLHQAVKAGKPACVNLLLKASALVDLRDEKGLTPLLLAGAGVSIEDEDGIARYEEVVTLLVNAGADVNVLNPDTGSSALHHAAARGSLAATKLLIERGADVGRRGANGETPLHDAAHCGADKVVAFLLSVPGGLELINKPDHVGCTPLHKAAYSGARESLALLLNHGGDLAATTHSRTSVLEVMFMYVALPAHFLSTVLDSCVCTNNKSSLDRAFKVHIDFRVLAPHGSLNQTSVMRGILEAPSELQHRNLIKHPLLETFLRLKWQRLRFFFFIFIGMYTCFLLAFSVHVVVRHTEGAPPVVHSITLRILQVFASLLLCVVLVQALLLPRYYLLSLETWVTTSCVVLALFITFHKPLLKNDSYVESHFSSIVMLLAWTELMLLIGRFPRWGNYALMFYAVMQNVLCVLVAFLCIVIGFALSFFVQFGRNGHSALFGNPWKAFVKTMVMMTGEYEYHDLFASNATDWYMVNHNSTDNIEYLHGTSRAIFLIFVVLASIVMVNLMVGLAVSDIQGIQAAGHFRRLLKQAEFVDHLELLISHKFLNKLLPSCFVNLLSRRRSVVTHLTIQPSSIERKHRQPHHLPRRLLESCVELAVRRHVKSVKSRQDYRELSLVDDYSSQDPTQPVSDRVDQTRSARSVEELLQHVADDLHHVKQMLRSRESSNSLAGKPFLPSRSSSPSRLRVQPSRASRPPNRRSSRGIDVETEIQSAQVMLHRLGSTRRSLHWT